VDALLRLLSPEVSLTCDGGGKAPAAGPRPVRGPGRVARLLAGRTFPRAEGLEIDYRVVNGVPAALLVLGGNVVGVLLLDLVGEGDRVRGVYAVTNPAKLSHLR
jgi:hypothetical protein